MHGRLKGCELMARIAIYAGHGGSDYGAIGVGGAREKDINLLIAKKSHMGFCEIQRENV